jgi:hypothetical protein
MANLTDNEAMKYAEDHLLYELQMLAFDLRSLAVVAIEQNLKNALIESYAIHLRNWIDFFYLVAPRESDVTWRDFVTPGSTWKPPACPPALDRARTTANKQIAHLTTSRYPGSDPRKEWRPEWATEILSLLKVYAKEVSASRMPAALIAYLS